MSDEAVTPKADEVPDPATPETLPADHPLVKTLEAQKAEIRALKEKAGRLDEIEEAQKTEAERVAERLAAATAEADAAKREALRYRVAAKHQISDEDAELFLTGSDEETLNRQAERLAARNGATASPRAPRPDLNQGRSTSTPANAAEQFAAAFEGRL